MSKKRLYVEGFGDKIFFESITKKLNVFSGVNKVDVQKSEIKVEEKRGVPNLKKNIDKELMEQLKTGGITHFGIVIDADCAMNGNKDGGFVKTLKSVSNIILDMGYGYEQPTQIKQNINSGFVFENNNGLPKIGLWIMPDNQNDGMFEDFVIANMKKDSKKLNAYAKEIVDGLHDKKLASEEELFKKHHVSKAQVGTWNAWQKDPNSPIKIGHIDENTEQVKQLIAWLKKIYDLPDNEAANAA
jgi:hypothetical protein